MDNIVVLGGSFLQSYFIRNAISSCNVYVLDGDKNCFASQNNLGFFYNIDFSDVEEVIAFCQKFEINSVIAPVNEQGNLIASIVSHELGFLYNNPKVVLATTDKSFYDDILKDSFLKRLQIYDELDLNKINYPVIVKPTQSTSSKGVSLVYNSSNLNDAIIYAKASGRIDKIKIEEYIEGKQFSIETISFHGIHRIVAVVEEHLSDPPFFFERSDFLDVEMQNTYCRDFENYVKNLLSLFNITVGACHVELRVRNSDIYLIDFASRSGGWRDIMLEFSGINYNQLILDSYLGKSNADIVFIPIFSVGAGILLYKDDIINYEEAFKSKFFVSKHFNNSDPVDVPKSLSDAYGYYFVKGGSRTDLSQLLPIKINL